MNMMEFVKLFRKVDVLEGNQNYIYGILKKLAKNDKRIKRCLFLCSINFGLLWIYNTMTDKEIKELKEKVEALEAAEGYKNCKCETGSDPEDMFK